MSLRTLTNERATGEADCLAQEIMKTSTEGKRHARGAHQPCGAFVRTYDIGIVPVVSDPISRNLTGVITDRDIAVRHVANSHMEDCTVGTQ